MRRRITRRGLLTAAACGAAGWMLLPSAASARSYRANEKLGIAMVGLGNRGHYLVTTVERIGGRLVALCDVNRKKAGDVFDRYSNVPKYTDFRKMLDELHSQLDAVMVATPDHNHAVISAAAIGRGKHVYCEKPIAHDVGEARTLRRLAAEGNVATQQGNQGMATDSFRRTLELIEDGAIGQIREAHVWYVFGGSGPRKRPTDRPPVPEYLHWDLWLGPAPRRPYHPSYVSGWWAWREYGTGVLGGGGSHSINMTFKALRLGEMWHAEKPGPTIRVEAETSGPCPENFPRWEIVRYHIPARGHLPAACIHWYNAPEHKLRELGVWEKLEKIAGRSLQWKDSWTPRSGSLLVGSEGVVHTNAHNSMCALLPEEKFPDSGGPPRRLPRAGSHEREWAEACRGGPKPFSNFDHSGPAIELMLLGNVATLVRRPLEYEPVEGRIVGDQQANDLLHLPHRKGWEVE